MAALLSPTRRLLASGSVALLEDGRVYWVGPTAEADLAEFGPDDWEPTCSLCDASGHGYPGAGPCPLEDSGAYESDPWL